MKALVVECRLPGRPSRLDEVASMARTIGYDVVARILQNRNSVHHSYTIGSGKLEEIKRIVEEKGVGTIIFANTLPSSHVFKVQRRIGNDVRVIDRNLLILELFDTRAMTVEAKLQIQLARLKYTFSWGREYLKLKGILGEQVGWSGPGDYPFKEYEKAARRRISLIRRRLEEIRFKRDLLRLRRRNLGYPIVALAGYTQSGKTTLFNRLTAEDKTVGLGPFTTLSTYARRVEPAEGKPFILVDSIGFIDEMHPIIVDAFTATLREIADADVILLLIDASLDPETLSRHLGSSEAILRRIDVRGRMIGCLNKIDLVDEEQLRRAEAAAYSHLPATPLIPISAEKGFNLGKLIRIIQETLEAEHTITV
ncbi:MAG: GTPase HflX [Candidatus Bathyarchaeia archaeon]